MDFVLILGPMKSGKSLELIEYFKELSEKDVSFAVYHPSKNVRDENVRSRRGLEIESQKIDSLSRLERGGFEAIGIDEIHMFEEEDASFLKRLLGKDIKIVASGLDRDYKGEIFPIIDRLLEMGPEVHYRKANCELCGSKEAVFTQIYKGEDPVLSGLPSVVPDDGTYIYKPVCEQCFISSKPKHA